MPYNATWRSNNGFVGKTLRWVLWLVVGFRSLEIAVLTLMKHCTMEDRPPVLEGPRFFTWTRFSDMSMSASSAVLPWRPPRNFCWDRKLMRHVKLHPNDPIATTAIQSLINSAYKEMQNQVRILRQR